MRLSAAVLFLAGVCAAQTPEERTAKYLDSVRRQPPLLVAFLKRMPKGADLHSHLAGAVYAESLIGWAIESGLCVDRGTSTLKRGSCGPCEASEGTPAVKCTSRDQALYNQLVDAWSMRNWKPGSESGHDRFFATFDKFGAALDEHGGEALAEVASRAAGDRLQHLELMRTADGGGAAALGREVGWDDDPARLREKLLAAGLRDLVPKVRARLDAEEARRRELLRCGTDRAEPGCGVSVRFLYQVLRGLQREQVFAQILLGFELTRADPRFVGFNLVMPEDWYTPMHDFDVHIRSIEALRALYPGTHIALHAGELAMGLVPPEGLRSHVRQSVTRAGAERIGHGVSVMFEDDAVGLLKEMARRGVLVEICLTSNDAILGISGARHPLPTYMKYGVPVALATDDQGVARSDMTHEWLRAVETYSLAYRDLKRMARASLSHSFLPGESLWSSSGRAKATPCRADDPVKERTSPGCAAFLEGSERASEQWRLEKSFSAFEREF
ncbi:MAG TPA: adenosine deaminase [Thermoanaerobaculia bacterium]|nr:adenosine deaminase [Thermoanaerobaculia bacterium]